MREFSVGQCVFVRNPHTGDKWIQGVVSSQGGVSYSVRLDNGRVRKCHIDQMRKRPVKLSSSPVVLPPVRVPTTVPVALESVETSSSETSPAITQPNEIPHNANVQDRVSTEVVDVDPPSSTLKEYPKRNRLTVERYDPSFK